MKVKTSKLVITLLMIVLGLFIIGCSQQEKAVEQRQDTTSPGSTVYEISIGYVPAPGSILDLAANEFARIAAEKSNGALQVKTFPSSQLGGEAALLDAMEMGTVDMAAVGATIINNVVPEYSLLSGYYLFETQEEFNNFLNGPVGQEMHNEILEKKKVRVLGTGNRGVRHMTSNKAVRTLSDLNQLTIRVPEQPIYIDAWRAMGANPIAIPGGELFTSLQQGIVDAQENPVDAALTHSFYEVQDYLILSGHQRSVFWWTIAESLYTRLPGDLKSILQESVMEAINYQNELEAAEEEQIINELVKRGMEIIEPDIAAFRNAVDPVLEKYAQTGRPDLYEKIKASR